MKLREGVVLACPCDWEYRPSRSVFLHLALTMFQRRVTSSGTLSFSILEAVGNMYMCEGDESFQQVLAISKRLYMSILRVFAGRVASSTKLLCEMRHVLVS